MRPPALRASAPESSRATARDACTKLFDTATRLEYCWAYPGERLLAALRDALDGSDAALFARLVQKVSGALLSGDYRRDEAAWDTADAADRAVLDALPPDVTGTPDKPYFEVLVVTPSDPSQWARAKEEMRRMQRGDDAFQYSAVHVGSLEDALLAVMVNFDLQAVVLIDGFGFASRHDLPDLKAFLARHFEARPDGLTPGALATALAGKIKDYRPELDLYLLSDRAPEQLAGSEEAAPIRRMFHHVEEPMEIHLAILDGIKDRYETPYFDNLKKYALRPIGTFHALPIARGKSIFGSNWIRDMGQFYGTNILFAESSATTGGLDSLLEPTGNIKRAQEAIARAFGAKRAYPGTNGTSTSNKIVVQAVCKPGDIVIVDRNCHKSHHYGFVLAGAQPYYVEAFPLTQYSMYGAVPLRTIKQALLDCAAAGTLDRVKAIDMTNCTFDGHMYNPRKVMEECLAIKPDLVFLWDEALVRLRPLQPAAPASHRDGRRRRADHALPQRGLPRRIRGWAKDAPALDPKDPASLDAKRLPDPDKVRIRVYQTNSTHKSMSAFRQGSMMLIWDEDFHKVQGTFHKRSSPTPRPRPTCS